MCIIVGHFIVICYS
uniref:Uncharacterized protein n=1 Tax=Anguilla anguilla TaxID=7936 RepID=A0A0E9QK61_ANGAN